MTSAALVLAFLLFIFSASAWPFSGTSVLQDLAEATDSSVTAARYHATYFPPGCILERVTFRQQTFRLITIQKLIVQGSYLGILRRGRSPHRGHSCTRVHSGLRQQAEPASATFENHRRRIGGQPNLYRVRIEQGLISVVETLSRFSASSIWDIMLCSTYSRGEESAVKLICNPVNFQRRLWGSGGE